MSYGPFGAIYNGSRLRPLAAVSNLETRRLLPGGPVGAVAPLNLGISNTSSGTGSYIPPVDGTTLLNATERMRWTGAAGAGTTVGHRNSVQIWNRDAFGGFVLRWVVRVATFVAGATGFRGFVGCRAATVVIPAANPSLLTDFFGFGFDPAATQQWALMHNDNIVGATVVPLGGGFDVSTSHLLLFEAMAERGGPGFELAATNLTTGAEAGPFVVAANMPAANLLFSENVWLNSGADVTTGAAVDVACIEAQTEALAA